MTEEAIAEVVQEALPGLPNGSASGVARLLACPSSVVLAQSSRTNEYAGRGTALHRLCRAVLTGTAVDEAVKKVPKEYHETALHIDFKQLAGDLDDIRCEVAYAVDPRRLTARELGVDIDRDYARFDITADEIPGSDDIEGMWYDLPVIADLKFVFDAVEPAETNPQLKTYAAAKAWITGAENVEGRILYVSQSGRVTRDSATYDRFALDSFGGELERALDDVVAARRVYLSGGVPVVYPGLHCKFCGALDSCPSQVALARAMVTETDALGGNLSDIELRSRIASLTLDQAGAAWKKGKQIEGLLERVMAALKLRALNETLPLGNGREVRRIEYPKESFVQARAIALLRDKGASEGEIAGLYRTTQIDTVREAAVPKKRKR